MSNEEWIQSSISVLFRSLQSDVCVALGLFDFHWANFGRGLTSNELLCEMVTLFSELLDLLFKLTNHGMSIDVITIEVSILRLTISFTSSWWLVGSLMS